MKDVGPFLFSKKRAWVGDDIFFNHLACINSELESVQSNTENYHRNIHFEGGWLRVLLKHPFWHF